MIAPDLYDCPWPVQLPLTSTTTTYLYDCAGPLRQQLTSMIAPDLYDNYWPLRLLLTSTFAPDLYDCPWPLRQPLTSKIAPDLYDNHWPLRLPLTRAGNSLIRSSLIHSFFSNQMRDFEQFAQITQDKWATVSESLRLLKTNEWSWVNRSGRS